MPVPRVAPLVFGRHQKKGATSCGTSCRRLARFLYQQGYEHNVFSTQSYETIDRTKHSQRITNLSSRRPPLAQPNKPPKSIPHDPEASIRVINCITNTDMESTHNGQDRSGRSSHKLAGAGLEGSGRHLTHVSRLPLPSPALPVGQQCRSLKNGFGQSDVALPPPNRPSHTQGWREHLFSDSIQRGAPSVREGGRLLARTTIQARISSVGITKIQPGVVVVLWRSMGQRWTTCAERRANPPSPAGNYTLNDQPFPTYPPSTLSPQPKPTSSVSRLT